MPGIIRINDLRNIKKLHFVIPDRGVWLLTAGNGAGKTSLLACLRRIGHPNAFPVHFASSLRSSRLDNHSEGSVTYEINGAAVEYAYRGERWTPRPRSNANLFERFGYASVIYIGASAERITPRPEDFDTRHIRSASSVIIDAANDIFDTEKFSMLRTINLARGTGNEAFVLSLGGSPIAYHSEKHFSLGELCVLKLLRILSQVSNNSMIIVDELEMALHPRAQVKLLRYLEAQARLKSLTVIFSTHSVTLLKTINRRQIIYLDKQDDGETKPIVGCYPTYAIGNIAADEETLPDIMLYVEDVFARDVLTAFFEMFANERFQDPTERPTTKIIPVGGFKEVVAFLDRNRSVLPDRVVQKAILDEDVSSETLLTWRQGNNHSQLAKFQRLEHDIAFLPFTPEVGLMNYISGNQAVFEQRLRERCADNQLRIGSIARRYDRTLQGSRLRDAAKNSKDELLRYIEQRTQRSEDVAREILSGIFAQLAWLQYRSDFMPLFGAMV
ncbi:AAA family ATPase [Bosea rubneri]|uniref:AAA family ATPase n=1 Tax=Bosea rubneri TaxID=3075434 RepID=A0ABU3S2R2_9HYPH|nr:AAA family ATPase [Bosea sp. ZW T0_25]MDU0339085.1 AAA family ATPase [Bosea sp. ZW T0_25]